MPGGSNRSYALEKPANLLTGFCLSIYDFFLPADRECFKTVWTAVFQFSAHLIWGPKLGKPGIFFVKYMYFMQTLFFVSILKICATLI